MLNRYNILKHLKHTFVTKYSGRLPLKEILTVSMTHDMPYSFYINTE